MSRMFNIEVFHQTIGQGKAFYTGQEFDALLGSADQLLVQVIVDAATDGATQVTATYETTNVLEEQAWITTGTDKVTVTVVAIANLPLMAGIIAPSPGNTYGGFGRFKVSTTHTGATVRIVVCGRSN